MTAHEKAELMVIAEIVRRIEAKQADEAEAREALTEHVRGIDTKTDDLLRRMAAVEPVTAMVTSWHAKMIGASLVLGLLGAVLGMGWAMLRDKVSALWAVIVG